MRYAESVYDYGDDGPEQTETGPEHEDDERFHPKPHRDRVASATPLSHLLLHDHKHEQCDLCEESVFLRKSNRRRHNAETFENFGDMITMD